MSVTLITTTGSRPEAFSLCEKYIQKQSFKGNIQWIVIDDNIVIPTKCTMNQEYYPNPLQWKEGVNTQRYGLAYALTKVKGDNVFIIEDDDFFSPKYIEVYVDFLKHAFLVGEGNSMYYNVKNRVYKRNANFKHCSTTQTAFKKNVLGFFEKALHSGEKYFDIFLWERRRAVKSILFTGMDLCIGIKGMPGRGGIGFGHNLTLEEKDTLFDEKFHVLPQLLGSKVDADCYKDFYVETKNE